MLPDNNKWRVVKASTWLLALSFWSASLSSACLAEPATSLKPTLDASQTRNYVTSSKYNDTTTKSRSAATAKSVLPKEEIRMFVQDARHAPVPAILGSKNDIPAAPAVKSNRDAKTAPVGDAKGQSAVLSGVTAGSNSANASGVKSTSTGSAVGANANAAAAKSPDGNKLSSSSAVPAKAASTGSGNGSGAARKGALPDTDAEQKKSAVENDKPKVKNAGAAKVNDDKSAGRQSKNNRVAAPRSHSLGLIPPPPPSIPTMQFGATGPNVIPGAELIEYISKDEAVELLSKTRLEIEKANKKLSATRELYDEKKRKSESFESLFNEGVVSRRELQTARHDFCTMEEEVQEAQTRIQDLQSREKRIQERLKAFNAHHR